MLEPVGAVELAAVLSDRERFVDRAVAVVLCGANVTLAQMRAFGALER